MTIPVKLRRTFKQSYEKKCVVIQGKKEKKLVNSLQVPWPLSSF